MSERVGLPSGVNAGFSASTEVVVARRRQFTGEYKRRILDETDRKWLVLPEISTGK